MTTDRRFIRPGIERVTTDRHGRWYEWDGERYWSVTTMIQQGVSNWPLYNWSRKFTTNHALDHHDTIGQMLREGLRDEAYRWIREAQDRFRDERADIGTTLHDYAEAHVLGKPKPAAVGEVAEMLERFQEWLDEWQPEYLMVEAPVFNLSEKYAGTLDAIIRLPIDAFSADALGVLWGIDPLGAEKARDGFRDHLGDTATLLVDYKTGKNVYESTALQLAAYRHAKFVGLPDGSRGDMPRLDGAAVLHLRADAFGFYPVRTDTDIWRSFLYAREMYRWHRDLARTVIGAPMERAR